MQRVLHLVRLEHRQGKQILGRRGRKRRVLLGRQRRQPVPGLGGDHDPGAAARDDVAELFEHQRGAVQIDRKDRRR